MIYGHITLAKAAWTGAGSSSKMQLVNLARTQLRKGLANTT